MPDQFGKHSFATWTRLMLWAAALRETTNLLDIARRAREAWDSPETRARDSREYAAFGRYLEQQPGSPKTVSYEHMTEFDALYRKEFGGFKDLSSIVHSCRMLAVIIFCQVLKPGNDDPGMVDANSKMFVSLHLGELLNVACPSEPERVRFQALREQLETARDKMLGHADAKAFSVEREPGVTKMLMFYRSLDGIDFDEFAGLVRKLEDALSDYAVLGETQ